MLASYAELRRMAPDALRMAGFSLSQADESAETLAWTEAAYGGALRFLLDHLPCGGPAPAGLISETNKSATYDCTGRSLLELGGRLIDYARAKAHCSATRSFTLHVTRTAGPDFLTYPSLIAAQEGYRLSSELVDDGELTIHCTAVSPRTLRNLQPLAPREIPIPPGERARPFQHALRHGIETNDNDYAGFASLVSQIRIPTSERSRGQAG